MSNQRYPVTQESRSVPVDLSFPIQPQEEGSHPLEGKLLYISTARYDQDWHSTLHAHSFSEIFYVTGGSGYFHFGDRVLPIRKNCLLITNPHVEHAESSQPADPLEYIVLGIEGLEFRSGEEQVLFLPDCEEAIGHHIRMLLQEARSCGYGHRAICQHLLAILLILLQRQKKMDIATAAAQDVQAFCAAAKAYIDAHFKEAVTLDELADLVRQNKFYLVHAFTKAYAMSPIKYLMKRKMDESKYLLAETDTSVADIGSIVGFSSASHFSQAFKRIVGCTPNAYRKSQRQKDTEPNP